jgi:hypothetical protein
MDTTQANTLIMVSHRLLFTAVLILAVLLFGDRIRQWIGVQGTETKENMMRESEADRKSTHSPASELKFVSRESVG